MSYERSKVYRWRTLVHDRQKFGHRVPIDVDSIRVTPFLERLQISIEERRKRSPAHAAENGGYALFYKILLPGVVEQRKIVIRIGVAIDKTRGKISTLPVDRGVRLFIGKISDRGDLVVVYEYIKAASSRLPSRTDLFADYLNVLNKKCHAYLLYNKNEPIFGDAIMAFVDEARRAIISFVG